MTALETSVTVPLTAPSVALCDSRTPGSTTVHTAAKTNNLVNVLNRIVDLHLLISVDLECLVQSQDHLRRVVRPELRQNKGTGRPYSYEYPANAIRIRGWRQGVGLFVETRGASTRKGIRRTDTYEKTEGGYRQRRDSRIIRGRMSCPEGGLRRTSPPARLHPCAHLLQVCSERLFVVLSLNREGDMARGIKCGG